jgi:DNA (cytosine-5)-methyltransferase 1
MKNKKNLKDYIWRLKNTNFDKNKGKVFSCFSGGGGSTMGYKLSRFDVIGNLEIDPRLVKVYLLNFHINISES